MKLGVSCQSRAMLASGPLLGLAMSAFRNAGGAWSGVQGCSGWQEQRQEY